MKAEVILLVYDLRVSSNSFQDFWSAKEVSQRFAFLILAGMSLVKHHSLS